MLGVRCLRKIDIFQLLCCNTLTMLTFREAKPVCAFLFTRGGWSRFFPQKYSQAKVLWSWEDNQKFIRQISLTLEGGFQIVFSLFISREFLSFTIYIGPPPSMTIFAVFDRHEKLTFIIPDRYRSTYLKEQTPRIAKLIPCR